MTDADIDRAYTFVRREGGKLVFARFTRFEDGSAVVVDGGKAGIYEIEPDAWRNALRQLAQAGYLEVNEAISAGVVTADEAALG